MLKKHKNHTQGYKMSMFTVSRALKVLGFLLILSPSFLFAENFDGLTGSAGDAKSTVQGAIASVLWILALLPIGVATFAAAKMKEHLENKEEQNQHEPKWMKFTKLISAFMGGLLVSFLVLGIFGKILLGLTFSETWTNLVVNFWAGVTTLAP
jgi:Mn2+/Fe2+ NRAMP family transporter